MNNVTISGRIANDLDMRMSASGKDVLSFTLAVPRMKRDETDTADFVRCVAFGGTAKLIYKYSGKGLRLGVVGRIQVTSYENSGGKHWVTDVVVNDVEIIDFKKTDEVKEDSPNEFISQDELPF